MILIDKYVFQKLIADVESQEEERCGFLFGNEDEANRTITNLAAVRNSKVDEKHTSFEITSQDYLCAERIAEEEKMNLLGVYHSHPNHPAFPSEYDRVAAQPYFSYIIVSVVNRRFADIRSWQLNNNFEFKEEKLALINQTKNNIYGNYNYPNTFTKIYK